MVRESECFYDRYETWSAGIPRYRWGDYSVVCVDPADGSFWAANELAKRYSGETYASWTTWWVNFDF